MINQQLNHFKITAHLGEGGMGTVYRAQDTRLGREVAIKLLPEAFAQDPDRLARFEREARLVANLNHPNICALYDVGQAKSDDDKTLHFLVMELVEGPDLSERILQSPVPIEETRTIAKQIATALEAAHENNIIHRDLKPANIKLTKDGQVKVLDFGLAKAWAPPGESSSPSSSRSPTITAKMTQTGMILGTAGYMSPEQAKGQEADRRSDIWSFGVVLHELLTGKLLFKGDSVSETLAAVLRNTVDLDKLPADTPLAMRALLARCLDRDSKSRLRDIGEARIALEALDSDSSSSTLLGIASATHPPDATATPVKRPWLPWSLAAVFAAATLAMFALWNGAANQAPQPLFRSSLVVPPEVRLRTEEGLTISPDGLQIAFVAVENTGISRLWVQRLADPEPRPLSGTEGAVYPFWSPDSRNLGFFTSNQLKRIAVAGGPPQTLTSVSNPRGGTWGEGGTIVYTPDFRDGLYKIASGGGEPVRLTQLDAERLESNHRFPHFLPDGKRVLFLAQTAEGGSQTDNSMIGLADLDSGEFKMIVGANSSMAYSPSGHLLFWREGALLAQPFDLGAGRTSGDAVPIAERVQYSGNEFASFSISHTGLMALKKGSGMGTPSRLTRMDRSGEVIGTPLPPDDYREIALSHNGRRVLYRSRNAVWIHDLERGTSSRLTFEDGDHDAPIFSPDDAWVLYGTHRDNPHEIRRLSASGMGEEELIFTQDVEGVVTDWAPDGRSLLLRRNDPETDFDLALFDFESNEIRPLVTSPFIETGGRFSPDGRWVAYFSYEAGQSQIYIVPVSGVGGKYQASTHGGFHPAWNPAGGELFYLSMTGELMAVDVVERDGLEIGTPHALFKVNHPLISNDRPYDVAPDGQSFLVNQHGDRTSETYVSLIQNWTRLLER